MEQFLDNIERYKFAIIGTILFHVIVFMTTNFVTIQSPYTGGMPEEKITEITLETDEIEIDPELLEMLNQQNELTNEQIYNLATDENDSRERSFENFSAQDVDQQVESDARELERQYFEEWAATHPDSDAASENSTTGDSENDEPKSATDRAPSNVDNAGDNAFAGKVMVSFNLPNRDAHSLEIPGYTCNGSGTVVIDIKVDKAGNVKSTDFNASKSRGASECMIKKAQRYAKKARFDYNNAASGLASGTITYTFQGQ